MDMSTDLELLIAELQAEFLDELSGRCNDLEDAVLSLESQQPGAFDELFRQVHSLKGTGGGVGVQIVTTICHQFESFISEAKVRFDGKATSTALAYIDLLRKPIEKMGRENAGISAIEHALDQMREANLSGRATILVVEPSNTVRALYQKEFSNAMTRVQALKTGIEALERMLQEPFDLLIISRELSDLNALAVVAALRESRSRNSAIPVIMVSSNTAPVPAYLSVRALVQRDVHLLAKLVSYVNEVLPRTRGEATKGK
jgi:chemotaxis protein histidine kinase CheA